MFSIFVRSAAHAININKTSVIRQTILANSTAASAMSKEASIGQYETLSVSVPSPFVYHLELNRPKQLNAMNTTMWADLGKALEELSQNKDCRVVVLSGSGRAFCAGNDLMAMASMASEIGDEDDIARRCKVVYNKIKLYQWGLNSLEKCDKPVITAVHGACIGAGVELICSADIRMCSSDAYFQIKEVDIGMAADGGTLQRLSKIMGSRSLVNELALTARKFLAAEAKESGFVSTVAEDKESVMKLALEMASEIASKSPVAVQMTKRSIVYSQDHSVEEGLEQIATWNQMMLQSDDFMNAAMAAATKSPQPTFSKL